MRSYTNKTVSVLTDGSSFFLALAPLAPPLDLTEEAVNKAKAAFFRDDWYQGGCVDEGRVHDLKGLDRKSEFEHVAFK